MTTDELITLSEITKESPTAVEGKTTGMGAELEARLRAEIVKWNAEHDSVDFEFNGEGVSLEGQRLLNAITERVRLWLGFSSLSDGICSQLPGSIIVSSNLRW
jgi:hypothetical protein